MSITSKTSHPNEYCWVEIRTRTLVIPSVSQRIASPFFASSGCWAAFEDDNNDDQGARKIGALTDDPVFHALDENQAVVRTVIGASSFSAPAAPSSVGNKRDILADDDDDDNEDGMSSIEEGRETI